jgi:hypothetical protein
MRVILHPVNRDKWAGITRYKNCHDQIGTYYLRNGSIYTGLSREDETRLSERLRLDLHPNSDFWNTFYIKVGSKDVTFDTKDPIEELKYLFLKNHKDVAVSLQDNNPRAKYVLINRDEEAKSENVKFKVKRTAIKELDKLSKEDIVKALRLFGLSSATISAEQAEEKLNKIVDNDPQKFLDVWVNNKNRNTQFLIEEAVTKNIIRKNKTTYLYGSDIIGGDINAAVNYLNDPKNGDLKLTIQDQLDIK